MPRPQLEANLLGKRAARFTPSPSPMPTTRHATLPVATAEPPPDLHLVGSFDTDVEPKRPSRRARKHQRDQTRNLRGWEQYRALWDGVDFKRQLLNMGDKKVRFALVIMGAANAVLFVVMSRDPMLHLLPTQARMGIAVLLVIYAITTFLFMRHAVEALRPAPEAIHEDAGEWEERELSHGVVDHTRHAGFIIRGPLANLSFEDERRLWSRARLSDVNAELILFNRASSVLLWRQTAQLRKVYKDLKTLVMLTAMILAVIIGASVWRDREPGTPRSALRSLDPAALVVGG